MRISSAILGNIKSDPFKITALCANSYIPMYAYYTTFTEEDVQFYKKFDFKSKIRKPNTINHIKKSLEEAVTPREILINGSLYYFMKGAMYTAEGVPLLVLAMPQKAYLNPEVRKFSDYDYRGKVINEVDYKNFVLFYSTSFFTDPNFAALNRRFQKEILMSCYEKGIEVRVITSKEIERNTFASIFEIPKVNSVDQLEEYMNKVLPNFLHTEEEDTFVFEELSLPQVQEELSVEEEALLFDSEAQEELPELELIPYDEPEEYAIEREEMEREAATWDSAHTEFPSIEYPDPITPAIDYAVINAADALTAHVQLMERNNRPIELIDDTE